MRLFYFVASTGIEPVSGASETLILSIVLRGQKLKSKKQGPKNKKYTTPVFLLDFVYWFLDFPILSIPLHYPQIFLRQWPAILRQKIFAQQVNLPGLTISRSTLKI